MDTFTPDELKLALGHHLTYRLLAGDGAVDPDESVFLERAFPRAELVARGFLRGEALTDRYRAAVEAGRGALPTLPEADRMDLLVTLWEAAEVDGRVDPSESEALDALLVELGLTRAQAEARLGLSRPRA